MRGERGGENRASLSRGIKAALGHWDLCVGVCVCCVCVCVCLATQERNG